MDPAFWKGRRVFLTGHTGFKGSWLSLWLQSLGAELSGYALPPETQPNLYDLARVGEGMHSHFSDIRDLSALQKALHAARPEIVIHMAAQPLVRHSYQDPVGTYATNVMGTAHVLESVRLGSGVRSVVVVTTDKCYENQEWDWGYRENEPMGGFDPYSSSKGCTELLSAAYRSSFFNPADYPKHGVALATARAGNVIGGGDWSANRLIPDILHAFERSEPVLIRHPKAIRPWQHVLEPLRGYLMLAERLYKSGCESAEAWNFGPRDGDARPVEWIVDRLSQMWPGNPGWAPVAGPQPHEAHYLKLDISKAGNRLNWQPLLSLEQSLGLIVDWARECRDGADMAQVTRAQIHTYQTQIAALSPS